MRAICMSFFVCLTVRVWGQTALGPASPAIQAPAPVTVPGSPALAPALLASPSSNSNAATSGLNATMAQLSALLTNLQNDVELTLPLATTFNDNFDFVAIAPNGVINQAVAPGSSVIATNSAGGLAVKGSMPNGINLPSITNVFGVPPGFVAFPITRDTLRGLLILQNDLQRMLPLLNAVNSGNAISVNAAPLVPSGAGP